MIEFIPVVMIHDDLGSLQQAEALPVQYAYSKYEAESNRDWAELQTTTDSFATVDQALRFFEEEFAKHPDLLRNNCYFLKSGDDQYIGSGMAWPGEAPFDESYGRLHWVVIRPDFRGLGLGRKLIAFILTQLNKRYQRVYLTTQTTSLRAINIYLDFGFRPHIENAEDERAWTLLRDLLGHPRLDNCRKI